MVETEDINNEHEFGPANSPKIFNSTFFHTEDLLLLDKHLHQKTNFSSHTKTYFYLLQLKITISIIIIMIIFMFAMLCKAEDTLKCTYFSCHVLFTY